MRAWHVFRFRVRDSGWETVMSDQTSIDSGDDFGNEAADIRAIAEHVVALAKAGEFEAIGDTYWDDDIISFEVGDGPMAVCDGIDAVRAKSEWWSGAHEIHSGSAEGPWVNGDQFTVRFKMDVTNKDSGQRIQMDEIALYTVEDGKIIEERFFY
jgi:hypothetical protein